MNNIHKNNHKIISSSCTTSKISSSVHSAKNLSNFVFTRDSEVIALFYKNIFN